MAFGNWDGTITDIGPIYPWVGSEVAMVIVAFVICRALMHSRVGYYWQAIREDEQAARALGIDTFRYKMIAVVVSAGMTAPAGVFLAFYHNNLFPEQIFHISQSIEIILAPIIGGIGTLFGPIIGAALLQWLAESLRVGHIEGRGLQGQGEGQAGEEAGAEGRGQEALRRQHHP